MHPHGVGRSDQAGVEEGFCGWWIVERPYGRPKTAPAGSGWPVKGSSRSVGSRRHSKAACSTRLERRTPVEARGDESLGVRSKTASRLYHKPSKGLSPTPPLPTCCLP